MAGLPTSHIPGIRLIFGGKTHFRRIRWGSILCFKEDKLAITCENRQKMRAAVTCSETQTAPVSTFPLFPRVFPVRAVLRVSCSFCTVLTFPSVFIPTDTIIKDVFPRRKIQVSPSVSRRLPHYLLLRGFWRRNAALLLRITAFLCKVQRTANNSSIFG